MENNDQLILFAKALSLLLDDGEGICVQFKGYKYIVHRTDTQIAVQYAEDQQGLDPKSGKEIDFEEGQMVYMSSEKIV